MQKSNAFLAVLWFLIAAGVAGVQADNRALFPGMNDYQSSTPKRHDAVNDARQVQQFVQRLGGDRPEQTRGLLDRDSTRAGILNTVRFDENRYSERRLARMQNLVAALFRLENSRSPADVQRVLAVLITWLRDPTQESLRRAFAVWLQRGLLPARLPTVSIPVVQNLVEVQSMLAERVVEWTQQWKEEGLREGRREGYSKAYKKAYSKA